LESEDKTHETLELVGYNQLSLEGMDEASAPKPWKWRNVHRAGAHVHGKTQPLELIWV